MASILLFVPSTFLTTTSLFNFCSLNLCLAAIFQSINIPVAPLSRNALTVIPLCVSIFSTLIFNYTSWNILNILLTSFSIPSPFAVSFRTLVHMLFCYASPCIGYAATLQSYYSCFFPVLHSRHKILFLSFSDTPSTVSFLPHWLYFMLTAPLSLAIFSLYLHTSRQLLYYTFLKCLPKTNPCLWFSYVLVSL